jgi:hypothetical protein
MGVVLLIYVIAAEVTKYFLYRHESLKHKFS